MSKRCARCSEVKEASEFSKAKNKDGLHSYCKECCREVTKAWKKDNPEKAKENSRVWKKNNPDLTKEHRQAWRNRNREKIKEYAREWKKNNPDKAYLAVRTHTLRSKYGLTETDYQEMLTEQGGVCKLCEAPPGKRKLAVDHCHSTGRIRGLLCVSCNTAIGKLKDNPNLMIKAVGYVTFDPSMTQPPLEGASSGTSRLTIRYVPGFAAPVTDQK